MTVQYTPAQLISKITKNNYSYTSSYKKKITETNTDVEKFQDKADTFRKKVKALRRYNSGGISKELLATQAEELVKAYNDMTKDSDKVTDKEIQKQLTKLEKLFSDNEKGLKKIGIEKVNGQYTFDSDTFEDARDKYIDAIFVGHDSFIWQADKILRKVDESTEDALYNVTEHKLNRTLQYQDTDILLATRMTMAGNTTSAIKSANNYVQAGYLADNDMHQSMIKLLENFAESVYLTDDKFQNENTDKLNKLYLDNRDNLSKVGLTFDPDEKEMKFDNTVDMTTSEFKTAYNQLFGPNASFGSAVSEQCKSIFNNIIQPEKIGVSIIDQYA